jgi:hypothetical protein
VREAPVLMAVAAYYSRADADADFDAVAAINDGDAGHVAAVLIEKGAAGVLRLEREHSTAPNLPWTGALLGAVLAVVAAPLGVHFLAPVVTTRAVWTGVAVLVSYVWYEIPKEALRQMSDVLETSQAALVVVAVNPDGHDIAAFLRNAATTIRIDSITTALEADYAKAIDHANAVG